MKLLRMIITGILIALSCSYILVTLSILTEPAALISGTELLEQIIIAAILGLVIGPMSLIFEWERIPLTLQLVLHLIAITICVLTAGYFGGWFDNFGIKNVLISEAIIYVIVWTTLYALQKKEIKIMNEAIQKGKE